MVSLHTFSALAFFAKRLDTPGMKHSLELKRFASTAHRTQYGPGQIPTCSNCIQAKQWQRKRKVVLCGKESVSELRHCRSCNSISLKLLTSKQFPWSLSSMGWVIDWAERCLLESLKCSTCKLPLSWKVKPERFNVPPLWNSITEDRWRSQEVHRVLLALWPADPSPLLKGASP